MGLIERGGHVRAFHVPNVTDGNLAPIIARHFHRDSRFMTGESDVYAHPGLWFVSHLDPPKFTKSLIGLGQA